MCVLQMKYTFTFVMFWFHCRCSCWRIRWPLRRPLAWRLKRGSTSCCCKTGTCYSTWRCWSSSWRSWKAAPQDYQSQGSCSRSPRLTGTVSDWSCAAKGAQVSRLRKSLPESHADLNVAPCTRPSFFFFLINISASKSQWIKRMKHQDFCYPYLFLKAWWWLMFFFSQMLQNLLHRSSSCLWVWRITTARPWSSSSPPPLHGRLAPSPSLQHRATVLSPTWTCWMWTATKLRDRRTARQAPSPQRTVQRATKRPCATGWSHSGTLAAWTKRKLHIFTLTTAAAAPQWLSSVHVHRCNWPFSFWRLEKQNFFWFNVTVASEDDSDHLFSLRSSGVSHRSYSKYYVRHVWGQVLNFPYSPTSTSLLSTHSDS